ncbi:Zinc finger-homeodomain protein 1 [Zostera marina]|uniref:Zinc finger-homeodomain protein 1 n=1 Tax=Zostera marina TaxID=29655 RepID=A0A0K9PWF1_ZOSMR|nr:Zinc finger-homeodomain protein 1 [Zostera marina]
MDLFSHEGEIPMEVSRKYEEMSNGLQNPTTTNTDTTDDQDQQQHISIDSNKKRVVVAVGVKYKECLKNHAASIGGNATDGCGEFMPSGKEGTLEGLKCSACNCHRNFHRKEMEGGDHHHHHHLYNNNPHHSYLPHQYFKEMNNNNNNRLGTSSTSLIPHNMIMPLGAMQTSESDEMEMGYSRPPMMKKRFRTKFNPEQKEKMLRFAERVGWRLQKQEESVVQQFCQEIGVRRRVLKVWMHNNKHNYMTKKDSNIQLDDQ